MSVLTTSLLFPAAVGAAPSWPVWQITDNTVDDIRPLTDGRFIVWSAPDGSDTEIWAFNCVTRALSALTHNTHDDDSPTIWRGEVAWVAHEPGGEEIFIHDLVAGGGTRVTDNGFDDRMPCLRDGYLTWIGFPPGLNGETYLCETKTMTTQRLTNDDRLDSAPRIDDRLVVWRSLNHTGRAPRFDTYNIDSGIHSHYYAHSMPVFNLDRGWVAWAMTDRASGGFDYDVHLHRVGSATTTDLTSDSYEQGILTIDRGYVVLAGDDGTDYEIFLYEIPTGVLRQPTNNTRDDLDPVVESGRVAWYGSDGTDFEIFVYDMATTYTTKITSNSANDINPHLHRGRVTWQVHDGSDWEIAFANGITRGITATAFGPYLEVTRAQAVTMVVRAANRLFPGTLRLPPYGWEGYMNGFKDHDHSQNMQVAEFNELLDDLGDFDSRWNPRQDATRGEVAAILYRLPLLLD
jgi:hypothetical protein